MRENNQAYLVGRIAGELELDHCAAGEHYYKVTLQVSRQSKAVDHMVLIVPGRLIRNKRLRIGQLVCIRGQFRSENRMEGRKNRLILSVFTRELEALGEDEQYEEGLNDIYLNGYVCKEPIYRVTPLGKEITDLILAINRPNSHVDYLPCVCWGHNATFARRFKVGDHVHLWGRIQSRRYYKKFSGEARQVRTAYEVSAFKVELVD